MVNFEESIACWNTLGVKLTIARLSTSISERGNCKRKLVFVVLFSLIVITHRGTLAMIGNLSLSTGICIPDTCSIDDAKDLANIILSERGMKLISISCESVHRIRFRIIIIAVVIFGILSLTVALCTIYELYMKREQRVLVNALDNKTYK